MLRRFRRDEGQELVEFALLALPLFLILFGIIEFGVAVWHYNTISNAAREGARAALVLPEGQRVQTAQDVAEAYAASMRVRGVLAEATLDEYMGLPTVVVSVSLEHASVTGLFSSIPMQASSTMIVE